MYLFISYPTQFFSSHFLIILVWQVKLNLAVLACRLAKHEISALTISRFGLQRTIILLIDNQSDFKMVIFRFLLSIFF